MYTDPTGYKFNLPRNDAQVQDGYFLSDLNLNFNKKGAFSGGGFAPNTWTIGTIVSMLMNSNSFSYWSAYSGFHYAEEDEPQSAGDGLWKIGELTYASEAALKQYIAIVVGESGNNMTEAAAIGSVIMNRLAFKGEILNGDFVSKIGGTGQYDAIGGDAYNTIMNSSWESIFDSENEYATRISGALMPLVWNKDYSNGAYFWNASYPRTGFNWNCYNNGTFRITTSIGGTTFFRYNNVNKIWP